MSLSEADRVLCEYAVKLTLAPGQMAEADITALRDAGLEEAQITVATQVIGYFNYINRIADGLGVDPEEWMTPPKEDWLKQKASEYAIR